MTLKKLTNDHYIIVDDSEIKEGDWVFQPMTNAVYKTSRTDNSDIGYKITHSTQSLGIGWQQEVIELSLQEVKELIGEVDVEKMIEVEFNKFQKENPIIPNSYFNPFKLGVLKGYNQALEDNKEKKYTEEDIRKAIKMVRRNWNDEIVNEDKIIQSLQPKTEWEVEFVEGKLKLK